MAIYDFYVKPVTRYNRLTMSSGSDPDARVMAELSILSRKRVVQHVGLTFPWVGRRSSPEMFGLINRRSISVTSKTGCPNSLLLIQTIHLLNIYI